MTSGGRTCVSSCSDFSTIAKTAVAPGRTDTQPLVKISSQVNHTTFQFSKEWLAYRVCNRKFNVFLIGSLIGFSSFVPIKN